MPDPQTTGKVVAQRLALPGRGVAPLLELLAQGATLPFIARYRKERTGDLDEVQIRSIRDQHVYLTELDQRRQTVLGAIGEQGKLTPGLEARIRACETKAALEDLYLPYKRKRRTKATVAREQGLEPLAQRVLDQPAHGDPAAEAAAFVDPERDVPDVDAALAGAREIVIETVADSAEVRGLARSELTKNGLLHTWFAGKEKTERTRFEDYYDHREPVAAIPSHRFLAIRRGEAQGVLKSRIEVDEDKLVPRVEGRFGLKESSPFVGELRAAVDGAWKRRLAPSLEKDVRGELKQWADEEAVGVFAANLEKLLMGAPYGPRAVLGIDPGVRTGCKCAMLDATGRFIANETIHPLRGDSHEGRAAETLLALVRKHRPDAVAVGNGTGGRETERFVRDTLRGAEIDAVIVVPVNESGASVYSASSLARSEFPDLDITVRGAISIARRLQDPLAELVKIEPKAIGVGQYQHDVHQPLLRSKLSEVVESCVNRVGVELNTASAPLLAHVAGVGPKLAQGIVEHREQQGRFSSRHAVLDVKGFGPKAFEQAAGFLRVREGEHPLDRSAVHPERYDLVATMAADAGVPLAELVGDRTLAARIDIRRYVSGEVGEPTLRDIVAELEKPGRDPRSEFEPPRFRDDVNTLDDLKDGMVLQGVVTNVTNFGAFVDVGVHQDGLVHISQLADRFVKDPSEVVAVGDRIQVRVLAVDLERRRISLSARSGERPRPERKPKAARRPEAREQRGRRPEARVKPEAPGFANTPFADLLKKR